MGTGDKDADRNGKREGGREGERRGKNNKNFTFSTLSLERYHPLKENTDSQGATGALGRAKTGAWLKEGSQSEGPRGLSLILLVLVYLPPPICNCPLSGAPAYV